MRVLLISASKEVIASNWTASQLRALLLIKNLSALMVPYVSASHGNTYGKHHIATMFSVKMHNISCYGEL